MLLEKDLKRLFHQLIHEDFAQISLGNSDITVRVLDGASKLTLTTPVYFGGNFIPKSVRSCLSQKSPFNQASIKTSLSVDENNFLVSLNYLGSLDNLNHKGFSDLLEEFTWLADEWRLFLDENDKNDLIHVHIPRQ